MGRDEVSELIFNINYGRSLIQRILLKNYWIFQLNLYYSLYLRQLSLMNTDCAALAFPAAIWWFFRANQEHIIVFYSGFANHICHQRFHKSTPDERHLLFFFQKYLTVFAEIETNSVTRKCFLYCMKKILISFNAQMIAAICNTGAPYGVRPARPGSYIDFER